MYDMMTWCSCAFEQPLFLKINVPAGHEFIISTDPKYSEICDDKIMWVDYVRDSASHLGYAIYCWLY